MKITSISPTVTHMCLFGLVNCWLVREDDGLTLIDTNLKPAVKQVVAHLASLGLPLRHILLTHAHYDHTGGMDEILRQVPTATVCIGAREAVTYREAQRGLKQRQFTLFPDEPQTPVKGSFHAHRAQIGQTFQPGDSVGSLRCVASPGHTPGHISFLDERDGTLFAGDALDLVGETRVVGDSVWYWPLPDSATWHKPTALASARNLAALRPEKICAGHGAPVVGGAGAALDKAIRHAEVAFAAQG